MLFFDPILSGNQKRSCASCHRPQKAFTDHRTTARGFRFTTNLTVNTPTILNVARQTRYFHDGRVASLEAVIDAVVTNPNELNTSYPQIIARLASSRTYNRLFKRSVGRPISEATIKQCLIAYLAQQNTLNSAYDRHQTNQEPLSRLEMNGLTLFMNTGNCATCHRPPFFRDGQVHQVTDKNASGATGGGQLRIKTPGLRNVALTPPYLADGSASSLDAVLLTDFHRQHQPNPLTTEDRNALVAFLHTLSDTTSSDNSLPHALPRIGRQPRRTVTGQY